MLRMDSKNTNYNGVCIVNENTIANFYGSSNSDGSINVNLSTFGTSNLSVNANALKADFEDFIDAILADL